MLPDQLPFEFDLDEDEPRVRYQGACRFVVSVSQIKMFSPSAKGCPRKWAMHYLAGFPRSMTIALRDGIRLHKSAAEAWRDDPDWSRKWLPEKNKDARKIGELTRAMMRHVPDRAGWISEPTYFLEVPELDTAIYIKPDIFKQHGGCIWIDDWKSTSAVHKRSPWVLQEPAWWPGGELPEPTGFDKWFSLQNDIQFRLYAHGAMTLFGGEQVQSEWIYGSKKFQDGSTPNTWVCRAGTVRADAKDWCETYVWPTIRMMNQLRVWWEEKQLDSILLVPNNPFSCEHKSKFCDDLLGHCQLIPSPVQLEKLHLPVIPA